MGREGRVRRGARRGRMGKIYNSNLSWFLCHAPPVEHRPNNVQIARGVSEHVVRAVRYLFLSAGPAETPKAMSSEPQAARRLINILAENHGERTVEILTIGLTLGTGLRDAGQDAGSITPV